MYRVGKSTLFKLKGLGKLYRLCFRAIGRLYYYLSLSIDDVLIRIIVKLCTLAQMLIELLAARWANFSPPQNQCIRKPISFIIFFRKVFLLHFQSDFTLIFDICNIIIVR